MDIVSKYIAAKLCCFLFNHYYLKKVLPVNTDCCLYARKFALRFTFRSPNHALCIADLVYLHLRDLLKEH